MSENKYNHELGKYSKRRLLCGLTGRVADRHILKIMLQSGQHPVAIIEEYERRDEVQRILAAHPEWKPVVRYVSANPELQDKYPLFTRETFDKFLFQHKIGFCVFSMVDHETDNFIRAHSNTDIAKSLVTRAQLEHQMADFVCHRVSNVYDNPWMFHYLSADRLQELKTNFYHNKAMARSMGLSRRELVETTLFMSYMIECLDGRNIQSLTTENAITTSIHQNSDEKNLRPSNVERGAITEKEISHEIETTTSARIRRNLIGEKVKILANSIFEQIRSNDDNKNGTAIRESVQEMNRLCPEIKKMHHRVQDKILAYVRSTTAVLEMAAQRTELNSAKRLYMEMLDVLKSAVLSNGQKEQHRTHEKEMRESMQQMKDRTAMRQAAQKAETKRISHAQQRFDDLAAQGRRTPEEVREAESIKNARRQADKERKILKRKNRMQKRTEQVVSEIQQVTPATPVKTPVTANDVVNISVVLNELGTVNQNNAGKEPSSHVPTNNQPFYTGIVSRHKQSRDKRNFLQMVSTHTRGS